MGISNREWLYSLDVADLAEWFDAEHVEDAISDYLGKSQDSEILSQDSDMDNDGLPPENDVSASDVDSNDANATQDTREKLEADVLDYQGVWPLTDSTPIDVTWGIVRGWLNRQVAITCNEQREWWGGVVAELQARVDELEKMIDGQREVIRRYQDSDCGKLIAERDELKREVEYYEGVDEAKEMWAKACERERAENAELQAKVDELTADRDHWLRMYEQICRALDDVARNYSVVDADGEAVDWGLA